MKKLFIYTVGICLLPAFTSCKDDREENKYTGINKIYLSAETPVITESENIPLTVNVDLTLTCEQDLVLNFELPDDKNGVLKLENNPVTIKAGKRSSNIRSSFQPKEFINRGYILSGRNFSIPYR